MTDAKNKNALTRIVDWIRGEKVSVAVDSVESSQSGTVAVAGFRTMSSYGLFGSKIVDKELLFSFQREPSAFRIVYGVARDTLDNWFTLERTDKEDPDFDARVQEKLETLHAKQKLTQLLAQSRLFGYSLLLLGYSDAGRNLKEPVSLGSSSDLLNIEPYSKLEIKKFDEVKDYSDPRIGYPEYYVMNSRSGIDGDNNTVHYSRAILCSTLLVDHKYKGWSVLQMLYDDMMGYRYMRWGVYMTMIRYGSGFPDITLKGSDIGTDKIDSFIASGQFDNINAQTYFVHNESQSLDFKGFGAHALNPDPYLQMSLETLSLGSGLPVTSLRGAQAGAITGSEINERAYFKLISDEQTAFEPVLKQLIYAVASVIDEYRNDAGLRFKIVWLPSYEETAKEKAEYDLLVAQIAKEEGYFLTIDEVRLRRFGLDPLPDGSGKKMYRVNNAGDPVLPELTEDYTSTSSSPNNKEDTDVSVNATEAEQTDSAESSLQEELATNLKKAAKDYSEGNVKFDDAVFNASLLIEAHITRLKKLMRLSLQAKLGKPVSELSPEQNFFFLGLAKQLVSDFKRILRDGAANSATTETVPKK